MRKIKLGFISPYDAMVPLINELKKDQDDLEVSVKVGNLESGAGYAQTMERQGVDILISRGGTAKLIREAVSIPVIDIHISGYDLLRSIMLASGHSEDKKALVGFSNITLGAASIVSLLEIEMEVVTIKEAAEVEPILLKLKEEGYKRILGDVVTVEAAAKLDLNGLLIQSGKESILESFEEAKRLFKTQQENQQLLRVMRELLKEREQDVAIVSASGKVLFENWASFKAAPLSSADIEDIQRQILATGKPVVKVVGSGGDSYSLRANLVEDRDGKVVSYFFKRLPAAVADVPSIRFEQISLLPSLVTESAVMGGIKKLVEEPAMVHEPIILEGETGTGKHELARYLHAFHKKKGSFIYIHLEEFEEMPKEFEAFNESTIFVHLKNFSVGENILKARKLVSWSMENNAQIIFSSAKIGGERLKEIGLQEAIRISLPPLTERKDDIPFLVRQFLTEFNQKLSTQPVKMREEALEQLKQMEWPFNLNDLKMYVKQLALYQKDYVIEKSTLQSLPFKPDASEGNSDYPSPGNLSLKEIEQKIIEQVLREEDFNQTKAAKRLGINRATLWRKLNK